MDIADVEGVKKDRAQFLSAATSTFLSTALGRISSVPLPKVDDKEWNNTIAPTSLVPTT